MPSTKAIRIAWRGRPQNKDYDAAQTYLSLLMSAKDAAAAARQLRKAPIVHYVARDVIRAAGVSPLGIGDTEEERQKILSGEKIAPLLLMRAPRTDRVVVADGFHRLCTVYRLDEQASVPCKSV